MMRSENEEQCSMPQSKPDDRVTNRDFHKKSKFSYSRDFLFSLAELDTCKTLPAGFDSSILREFDDQSTPLLPCYHDLDAGRFQSSPSNGPWRNPQQGILGSGAFARVYGGVAQTNVPLLHGSGSHLLNRSSEPYRPPHLCKAKYYSEIESKDVYNGQTFGSDDNISQERAEEEKQRRDSFALMRKEKEMAAQAKQKIISDEHMPKLNPDIAVVLLEDSEVDKKVANKDSKYKGSEPCNVKEGYPENPVLYSSNSTHQFPEAGILSRECLEESILSEINGHYSTRHRLIHGRSNYYVEDSQSSCSNYNAASQHFLSFLPNGVDLADPAESSKLNMWSLDKPFSCETGKENHLNKLGRVCMNNSEKSLPEPISGTDVQDLQSTEFSVTQEHLTNRSKGDDGGESYIPLPVEDNCIIPFTANESGSIGDESIMFSSFVKQTDITRTDSDLTVSKIQANEGLDLQGWPESKHNSLISFDELDICLPDEDSLITADDFIFPQDSISVAGGNTSSYEKLADCDVAVSDERFDPAGSKSPTSFHGFHDLVSLENSIKSLSGQQSRPHLHHSQLKTEKAQMSQSKFQERKRGSKVMPRYIKNHPYNLQSIQYCPNVHLTPPQHLQAAATGIGQSVNHQCLQDLPFPGLPHQLYSLPRVAFPQYNTSELACYDANFQNAMLNPTLNFNQQRYRDLENASSRYYGMGIESKADASPYYGWPYPGSYW